MANWKLTLMYDGSAFHGWQVQPGLPSIQGALANALHRITGETVLPQGSGRTDAGVHALGQVCSFTLQSPLPASNLQRALNRVLSPSIRIVAAEPVGTEFHARHSARRKTYEYRIFEKDRQRRDPCEPCGDEPTCTPFLAPFVWDVRWPLALEPMQQSAAALCGTHDFTSFTATEPDRSTRETSPETPGNSAEGADAGGGARRTMFHSGWQRRDGLLLYRVTGSGFLHHMVRNFVGTMVEIGRGSLAATEMEAILAARDRRRAGPTAPARGLFLLHVEYASEESSAISMAPIPPPGERDRL